MYQGRFLDRRYQRLYQNKLTFYILWYLTNFITKIQTKANVKVAFITKFFENNYLFVQEIFILKKTCRRKFNYHPSLQNFQSMLVYKFIKGCFAYCDIITG